MSSTIQIRGNNELKQKSNMIIQEIKLKIHEESDLYSSYDPDQKLLSEDVTLYLAHNYLDKHRKSNEKYTLRIISDTPVNQENVKERIHEYYSRKKATCASLSKDLH